ncbi:uncharacterized protein [Porites lutea]|uniref:uncharacterized protein n=1 Tax=Porites lutea TaxID=51062 RepID=UPI003CC5109F
MSADQRRLSVSSIRRFPVDVREELNRLLRRSSWQSLTREFSTDVLTGLKAEALDDIADFVNSDYPEFQEDVRKRVTTLKSTIRGKTQSFKGKSKVGFHSYFYRFWLVGQHNDEGLYDIVFCHICRKEEFDFFLCLNKVIKGGAYMLASAPQAIKAMIGAIPARVMPFLERGVFLEGEKERPEAAPAQEGAVSPYTDLTQDLGDRLTEYELVEDLIERGTLEENSDGTLSIRLQ